jgi:hypothetical protein
MFTIHRPYGHATSAFALAVLLAQLVTASPAAGVSGQSIPQANAVTITMAVDGGRDFVAAAGVIAYPAARTSTRIHVVLQQLIDRHGHGIWASRRSGTATYRYNALRYRLRWRHPPLGHRLQLRTIATSAGKLIARSTTSFARAGDPGAVFYSGDGDAGANRAGAAKWILTADAGRGYNGSWVSTTKCDPSKAANVPPSVHGENITTLAGFSKGRLGPIYYLRYDLKNAPPRAAQVNYVLLYDPGTHHELEVSCDSNPSIAPRDALRSWLSLNPANKLVILAGSATEPENHRGIEDYYLRSLSATTTQRQVLVCDTGRSHESVMTTFAPMIGAPAPSSCPIETLRWNPPTLASPPTTGTPTPPPLGGGAPAPTPLPAGEFAVMNATGGIYWRTSPDWGTPEAVAGNGVYPGTIVKITCYQAGAGNVPDSTNSMWEQASWVSGPGGGGGWINEHFLADGAALNQPSPGAPPCGSSPPPPAPPPPPSPSISASKGGPYLGGYALNIQVHNFPTGVYTYYCHDNSGPSGSDTIYFSHAVAVNDPNQASWPGVFCYDSAPYVSYLVMGGVASNGVQF